MSDLALAGTSVAAKGRSRAVHASPAGSRLTLLVIVAGSLLSSLDLFIVNLAFSSIRDSFPGATNQALSWVLSAYTIMFAALLVPAGRLADRYGRKRVFRIGLLTFALASAGCALAPDVLTLVAARVVKGAGAALVIPTSLGLLLAAYPPERHKQMVGIWAAVGSVGAALGPVLGGLLVHLDWRLIFLINLPVALPAWWLGRRLAETPRTGTKVPDMIGSACLAVGIGCVVAAISYAADWGAASIRLWATLGTGAALLALFAWRCLRSPSPALDLRVFRIRAFAVATVGMGCFYCGFAMTILGGTMFLTQVWHWDTVRAGIGFALGPAAAGVAALAAGRVRIAPRLLSLIGGALFTLAGLWWFLMLDARESYFFHFLPGTILTGTAAGIAQTGFLSGGAAALPASELATGTGILNTSRQIGGAIGIALFVAVTGSALGADQYRIAWLLTAASSLAAVVSALWLREGRRTAPTHPKATM